MHYRRCRNLNIETKFVHCLFLDTKGERYTKDTMAEQQQSKLRLRDRRRRLVWIKVAAGTGVIVVSLALIWYVARIPALTIAEVQVSGTKLVSADSLQALVKQNLQGSYAYVVPYENTLVFPAGSIKASILKAFPPINKVSISRNGFNGLAIAVEERTPVALWCAGAAPDGGSASSTPQGSCSEMDKGGFVFADAQPSDSFVHFYGDLSTNAPIGSTYMGGDFAALNTLVQNIGTAINHVPESVAFDSATKDVSLAFADGGVLKFVEAGDTQSTLENIASVFASQNFKTHKAFEYVDFRFGDKVYVKFK